MKQDTKAIIFLLIWELFFYIGLISELVTGGNAGWCLFLVDSGIQGTMLYYDFKIDRLERELRRTRKRLGNQSAEYTQYINTHKTKATKIVEIVHSHNNHKKIHRKVS